MEDINIKISKSTKFILDQRKFYDNESDDETINNLFYEIGIENKGFKLISQILSTLIFILIFLMFLDFFSTHLVVKVFMVGFESNQNLIKLWDSFGYYGGWSWIFFKWGFIVFSYYFLLNDFLFCRVKSFSNFNVFRLIFVSSFLFIHAFITFTVVINNLSFFFR